MTPENLRPLTLQRLRAGSDESGNVALASCGATAEAVHDVAAVSFSDSSDKKALMAVAWASTY